MNAISITLLDNHKFLNILIIIKFLMLHLKSENIVACHLLAIITITNTLMSKNATILILINFLKLHLPQTRPEGHLPLCSHPPGAAWGG